MKNDIMFKYYKAIGDIKSSIDIARTLEEALQQCVQIVRRVSGAQSAVIWYYDRDGDKMLHAAYSLGPYDLSSISVAPGEGVVGRSFAEDIAIRALDYQRDGSQMDIVGFDKAGIRSMMCVPLSNIICTLGCILLVNRADGNLFIEDDADVCEIMATMAAMAIGENELDLGIYHPKPAILSLRGVKKEFPNGDTVTQVLKGVDIDVYEGELLMLLGESGCGKSTLLNIIGGLDQMNSGSFMFMGQDYSHADEKTLTEYRREHIGFIFQSYYLMPNLTARQNLQFIADLKKDSGDPDALLDMVGLSDRKGNYPSQMSGGQQQRVSIARALVKRPRLILADEPTAALDYATGIEVLSVIEQVAATGTCIIMVTHNEEITRMANRVVRIRDGRIDEMWINRRPAKASALVW